MNAIAKLGLYVLLCPIACSSIQAEEVDNTLVGKVVCGYQGWFNCYGDGSTVRRWEHWSKGGQYNTDKGKPAAGNMNIDTYPDITEYPSWTLYQTDLADLSDGTPAKLYSSYKEDVIDTHFRWMKENGIDGAALQRFYLTDGVFVTFRDSVAARMMRSAERHGRIFYIMYDLGAGDISLIAFQNDWARLEKVGVTQSPNYATQDGKPVICLWGYGFNHRAGNPESSKTIIDWLKDEKGYYVIGGVPTNWRTGDNDSWPDFQEVYDSFDMISPWMVGRDVLGNEYPNRLAADMAYCAEKGIEYQPVIWSGFAWYNMHYGKPPGVRNQIPRRQGNFLWNQIKNVVIDNKARSLYVAMFDEFDEATNITKAADSYLAIPSDQYFLTYSADGVFVSSDFYLRLVGHIGKILRGEAEYTNQMPIPLANGPYWFRTSVEDGYDAMPVARNRVNNYSNVTGPAGSSIRVCRAEAIAGSHSGKASIFFNAGSTVDGDAYCSWDIFEIDIPIQSDTEFSYWFRPLNESGRYAIADLLFDDDTRLSETDIKDSNNVSIRPATGRGTVNQWQQIVCNLGTLEGKRIKKILITFENAPTAGDFSGHIDDIVIKTTVPDPDTQGTVDPDIRLKINTVNASSPIHIEVKDSLIYIHSQQMAGDVPLTITIFDLQGKMIHQETLVPGSVKALSQQLSQGVYIIKVNSSDVNWAQKVAVY